MDEALVVPMGDEAVGARFQRRAVRTIFVTALRQLRARYAPVAEILPTIRVPALVAWGARDPFFPPEQARRTADLIPAARFVVYDDAGHFLPEEVPDAFTRDVLSLLEPAPAGKGATP